MAMIWLSENFGRSALAGWIRHRVAMSTIKKPLTVDLGIEFSPIREMRNL